MCECERNVCVYVRRERGGVNKVCVCCEGEKRVCVRWRTVCVCVSVSRRGGVCAKERYVCLCARVSEMCIYVCVCERARERPNLCV